MQLPPDVLAAIEAARAEGRVTEVAARPAALSGGPAPLARPEVQAAVTEAEFQRAVIDLARQRGWKVAHFRKVRVQRKDGSVFWETPVGADGKGFPDLCLVRDRLVFVELKVPRGKNKPRPEQKEWHAALGRAGVEWYVFRPADWPEIVKTLT